MTTRNLATNTQIALIAVVRKGAGERPECITIAAALSTFQRQVGGHIQRRWIREPHIGFYYNPDSDLPANIRLDDGTIIHGAVIAFALDARFGDERGLAPRESTSVSRWLETHAPK